MRTVSPPSPLRLLSPAEYREELRSLDSVSRALSSLALALGEIRERLRPGVSLPSAQEEMELLPPGTPDSRD